MSPPRKIIAWNVASTKAVELVDVPVRMALRQRDREGHPIVRGELTGHADAQSKYTSITIYRPLRRRSASAPRSGRSPMPTTTR